MERKHESDLTPGEKRKLARETVKSLKGKKKAEYLWTYYKYILVIVLLLILIAATGVSMYRNLQRVPLLTVAIVDADRNNQEGIDELKADILKELKPENKHDEVVIDTSASSADTDDNLTKTTILVSVASDTDVLICNQEVYDRFKNEYIFLEVKDLSKNQRWIEGQYVNYEPAYLCILKKTKHREAAETMLEYFERP